ncbi:AAA family ATPase [Planococcus lenghuensis]|uniref:AAA+ ATPase domain-containing protein n=1 Tax=Planococcus lenghuensis TaxID=2213202 RepID=A0A1Q2L124_9BACL|nr:AAA family ATPase [Planococcus lenghuensis]AQQ54165.1 hypothetical protein B0X71_14325 [Planococcus lenghuensis]
MESSRLRMLYESMAELDEEVQEALAVEDISMFRYHLLRAYRLIEKVQLADHHSLIPLYHYLSNWHQKLAQFHEAKGETEEAEREWLSSISYHTGDADRNPYVQFAHAALAVQNLSVARDIDEHMPYITQRNVKSIQVSLRKARFSIRTAVSRSGINDSTSYILGWIDEMEKVLDAREDLKGHGETSAKEPATEDILRELDSYIGLTRVKKRVNEICNLVIFNQLRQEKGLKADQPSLHMVFTGNPGTGKTTIARIIARLFKSLGVLKSGHLVEVGRADLVGEYIGHTAIKTLGKLKEAKEGVLFIDEAYSLVRGQANDFGREAIDTIVKEMEDKRKELVIILAGYPQEMNAFLQSNPGLKSRFSTQITFDDYQIDELMEIGEKMLKEKQYEMTEKAGEVFRKIIMQKIGEEPENHGNGRLVRNIIEEAIFCKADFVVSSKKNGLPYGQLDQIEQAVMHHVLANMENSRSANKPVDNDLQFDSRGVLH